MKLIQKHIPIISFGNTINEYIESKKLPHSNDIHKEMRQEFRKKYGMPALAILNREKINLTLIDEKYKFMDIIDLFNNFSQRFHV